MVILQGDIFWFDPAIRGSAPGFRRPLSSSKTMFSTPVASRLRSLLPSPPISTGPRPPGNVLLRKGEANLPGPSVVNVSQILTADKSALKDKIGTLSRQRIQEVISSLGLLFRPQDLPKTPS